MLGLLTIPRRIGQQARRNDSRCDGAEKTAHEFAWRLAEKKDQVPALLMCHFRSEFESAFETKRT
jgi:hypothetical protein